MLLARFGFRHPGRRPGGGDAESEHADRTIAANYGLGRRLYEGMSARLPVSIVYVEVQPKR